MIGDEISTISADYFYTHFFNALMADMDVSPQELHIKNTTAVSYSHAFQVEISIKPIKQLELRTAFKYYDVRSTFNDQFQTATFVPKYRVLFNLGYGTRNKKWMYDLTANLVGKQRLASTASNPLQYRRGLESKEYVLINSQLTYNFKRFSIYLGGENLLNVMQKDAIIAADDPFGSYFDATQLWAPINGFNVYAGLHFDIKQKTKDKKEKL
jgi:outer membrane receptor for ferrienterochelin and colicin